MKSINFIQNRLKKSPFMLIHLITSKCNCKCKICNLWKNKADYENDLSLQEIFSMLDNAHKAGFKYYTVVGGEPLMRKDIPQILEYAKKLNFSTSLITNGFYLKERCSEILPFIDNLEISIDSNDCLHDEMRGVKGLLDRSLNGIKLCKNSKTNIIINNVISKANADKIQDLLDLSKSLNVSISFQPIDHVKGYNDYLILSKNEIKKLYLDIIKFKKTGYKIANSNPYLKHFTNQKKYICHGPKCMVVVKPNGDITSCLNYLYYDKIWGNVKNTLFSDIFKRNDFKNFCNNVETCNDCNGACVIESSLAYSLNPRILIEKTMGDFLRNRF